MHGLTCVDSGFCGEAVTNNLKEAEKCISAKIRRTRSRIFFLLRLAKLAKLDTSRWLGATRGNQF